MSPDGAPGKRSNRRIDVGIQLRHRHGETPGVGAEIRLAAEQAALLGAYERDVTEALAALRRAGAAVAVEVPDYLVPPTATGPATLRLRW